MEKNEASSSRFDENDPETMELVTYCIYSMSFTVAAHLRQFRTLIAHKVIPIDGFRPLMAGYVARIFYDSIRAYGSIADSLAAAKKEFGEITMDEAMDHIKKIAEENLGIKEGFDIFEEEILEEDAPIKWGGL